MTELIYDYLNFKTTHSDSIQGVFLLKNELLKFKSHLFLAFEKYPDYYSVYVDRLSMSTEQDEYYLYLRDLDKELKTKFNIHSINNEYIVYLIKQAISMNDKFNIYVDTFKNIPEFKDLNTLTDLTSFVDNAVIGESIIKVPVRRSEVDSSQFFAEDLLFCKELIFTKSFNSWLYTVVIPLQQHEKIIFKFYKTNHSIEVIVRHVYAIKFVLSRDMITYHIKTESFNIEEEQKVVNTMLNLQLDRIFIYYNKMLQSIDSNLIITPDNYLEIFSILPMINI